MREKSNGQRSGGGSEKKREEKNLFQCEWKCFRIKQMTGGEPNELTPTRNQKTEKRCFQQIKLW